MLNFSPDVNSSVILDGKLNHMQKSYDSFGSSNLVPLKQELCNSLIVGIRAGWGRWSEEENLLE